MLRQMLPTLNFADADSKRRHRDSGPSPEHLAAADHSRTVLTFSSRRTYWPLLSLVPGLRLIGK